MPPSPTDDTNPRAARVRLELLRRWSPAQRIAAGLRYSRSLIAMSRAMLRERHPEATREALSIEWVSTQYGTELAARLAADLARRR